MFNSNCPYINPELMNLEQIIAKQKSFFRSGATRKISFRKEQLQKLLRMIQTNEKALYAAIYKDLGKSELETYATEISFIKNEIQYFSKNLNTLSQPHSVSTNLINQVATSKIYYEPYGNTLVIGPWNYPYQLSLVPSIAAIAAGNTVILKPSEIAANTAMLIGEMINEHFPAGLFYAVQGGVEETTQILKHPFDKIFFTGSPAVGKIVYQAAARHLTPVTLELGGKSPAIVGESANLEVAARRIAWGKFLNAGQSCVAPDYVYVHENRKELLVKKLISYIEKSQYLPGSENYSRIINLKNFNRLKTLMQPEKIIYGGSSDESRLYLEPTLISADGWDEKVMQEEIFGPLLPILTFTNIDDVFEAISNYEKPLSAYLFTRNRKEKGRFINEISFGGGCINDTVMHLSNPNLPFGGVGNSGLGSYHGKYGFLTFSHQKSVMDKTVLGEPNLKYPPYTSFKKKWLKRLM